MSDFEYDPVKSAANKAKHGIDFDEAQAIWRDERHLIIDARYGPDGELRRAVIGRINDLVWTAIVTVRGGNTRLISVRRSRAKETELYE